jgi:hypothetical protein
MNRILAKKSGITFLAASAGRVKSRESQFNKKMPVLNKRHRLP